MPDEFRRFPILTDYAALRKHPDWPCSVPWSLVVPHAHQARLNHQQSLSGLTARGGLAPLELYAVLKDLDYRDIPAGMTEDQAITEILALGGIRR